MCEIMAEAIKRNPNSKTRKSKNEIIRATLGIYLKQRNYSASEKFRKCDLARTQNAKQTEFSMKLEEDLSKGNSLIYSNVLCLSNNAAIVEQQFSKFLSFVQSQTNSLVKNELQAILSPLLCHLYIELLKGRDSQPAQDFIKKFAHIVGTIDNLTAPSAHKLNGTTAAMAQSNDYSGSIQPSASTHITFMHEFENEQSSQEYFKDLVQAISMCLRIEELDAIDIARNFRYSKYESELSQDSIRAMKQHLNRNGHVIILHIFQAWFTFDINDINGTDDETMHMTTASRETMEIDSTSIDLDSNTFNSEYEIDANVKNDLDESFYDCRLNEGDPTAEIQQPTQVNHKLRYIRYSAVQMKNYEQPVRVFKVNNAKNKLTSGHIDNNECHMACGFEDSVVKLWPLNQSTVYGRKPFSTFNNSVCEWNLEHCNDEFSSDDEDLKGTPQTFTFKKKHDRAEKEQQFWSQRNYENVFSDSGGISLRGHTKGITDVMFSKHSPLLFTVSKDRTMRAWKSSDYVCGAVYRGHNYPVWCVTESSIGLYLATGSRDYTARLWSTDREFPLQTYVGHTQDVDAIAFHPNGNYIATGSTDLTVRLWCVTSGKLFRVFTDCHLPVQCVSFSPDGKFLAAAGEETKIRIFDLAAGSQLSELKDHTAPVTGLVWNSAGNEISSCCADGSVKVFSVNKLNNNQSAQNPSTSSSTSTGANKLLVSYATNCKRCVRNHFNTNGSVSCIGSS